MSEMAAAASLLEIGDLPDEVLLSIFSFVPVADLARCAGVCKEWHKIVTGFTHLWKGKSYQTDRRPSESAELRAILRFLPPLEKLVVNATANFKVEILYPRLVLSVPNVEAMLECQALTCEYLSTRLEIVADILYCGSTIDFEALRKLRIHRRATNYEWTPSVYRADSVIASSLELCPNLRGLLIDTEFLSADYLDALEGMGRLHILEIECPGLEELVFLRHCVDALEELHLCCPGLPPEEFTMLRRLVHLRKLSLSECRVAEADLQLAPALGCLQALQLYRCDLVRDLSLLRRCGRLRQLLLTVPPVSPARLRLTHPQLVQHVELPAGDDVNWRPQHSVHLETYGLASALPLLEQLDVDRRYLDQMGYVRRCPHLCQLSIEFHVGTRAPEPLKIRVNTHLTRSP